MKNFLVHNEESTQKMCEEIGINKVEELFKQIPQSARMGNLDLSEGLSEMETQRLIKGLAKENKSDYIHFMGGGIYNKFVPACINQVAQRFEFNTAYTPYQPEISQGTLQVMYEFQTMICRLTGMDISNATVYDGGTACAESILMACRISKKYKGSDHFLYGFLINVLPSFDGTSSATAKDNCSFVTLKLFTFVD